MRHPDEHEMKQLKDDTVAYGISDNTTGEALVENKTFQNRNVVKRLNASAHSIEHRMHCGGLTLPSLIQTNTG